MRKYITSLVIILLNIYSVKSQQLETGADGYQWYRVEKKDKIGIKSISGERIIPIKYANIYYTSGYFIANKENGYKECFTNEGKRVIGEELQYTAIFPEKDVIEWFSVKRNEYYGAYVYIWGEVIPPNKYISVRYKTDCNTNIGQDGRRGYFLVQDKNGYHGIDDAYGLEIISTNKGYEMVYPQGKGLYSLDTWFLVKKDGLYGACDINGIQIFPTKYKYISHSKYSGFSATTTTDEHIDLGYYMSEKGLTPKRKAYVDNSTSNKIKNSDNTEVKSTVSNNKSQHNCNSCNGTLNCYNCKGTGNVFIPMLGNVFCTICGGTGVCPICHGDNVIDVYPINANENTNKETIDDNSYQKSRHKCNVCNGTGTKIKESWMGGSSTKWCDICKKQVYVTHQHVQCNNCHGKGYSLY